MEKDQEIFDLIEREHQRQLKGMELIASENFVSEEVMKAMGSYLTNKVKRVATRKIMIKKEMISKERGAGLVVINS